MIQYKKKEATRIDEENSRMIDRIMNANAVIPPLKLMETDYSKHLQIKKNIQKSQPIPLEQIIKKKQKQLEEIESQLLPPI